MRIITNERLIKRNARIGQIASLLGLLVLVGGLYFSFQRPDQGGLWLGLFVLGFALSQLGIYFGNRYVRPPRPDQALNTALKGMDKNHTLYHFRTPVSHLLVGPSGIWAIFPRYQRGTIVYEKNRWRQKGGGIWLAYLKLFSQEGLGRPDLEISAEIEALQKLLKKELPEDSEFPPINSALLFTHPDAKVEAEDAPIPTLPIDKIKNHIRKNQKETRIPAQMVKSIQTILEGGSIEDNTSDDEDSEE